MTPWNRIEREVQERAGGRCEYCRMHQVLQGATFHVEHVVPRSLGGYSVRENLAWACPSCNLHESNRITFVLSDADTAVPLFNPRIDKWAAHFCWHGYHVVALTQLGRATVKALLLNSERRVLIRQAEAFFNLFPPL